MAGDGKGIEHGLLLPDEVMRRGYSAIIKNCGKLIAALTASGANCYLAFGYGENLTACFTLISFHV